MPGSNMDEECPQVSDLQPVLGQLLFQRSNLIDGEFASTRLDEELADQVHELEPANVGEIITAEQILASW